MMLNKRQSSISCAHLICLIFAGVLCLGVGQNVVTQNEDGSEGSITFKTPKLDDEEAHSMHMPSHLKCDACTAIVYQLTKVFDEFHSKRKSLKSIPESEMYRIIEDVCSGTILDTYGVKDVKKVKRLSGPGLEAENVPGIMAGGGKWPNRMKTLCSRYVEEFEEEGLYREYKKHDGSLHRLLCENSAQPSLTDVCLNLPSVGNNPKQEL
ncbi:marginal zone B- and B1-cell-specific protein-like [Dreissena polymorpha]|uniref:DUF3456 domain-containing protein n=1 Tax=Dreissena polymorpha TaxID=45954 RepID=A0A9D4LZ87_DREPO|nr:marginal zone B- and B1-cell-specific protein-like [Dreissena polymorpha]XP_052264941.1 marginal zone B- and B1-cell-specific protein-like [Dreissena polymorpha]KAH3867831.1 hypothetical protein DPMN_030968 [Dreissena polymorpha]KAH3867905.1 hypothetical protein DPMN_031042 [Dreissena polymorpha]